VLFAVEKKSATVWSNLRGFFSVIDCDIFVQVYTLCSKISDAKIQITITTAYLIRIKYPLRGFNYRLSDLNFVNFNKIHSDVSKQQLF